MAEFRHDSSDLNEIQQRFLRQFVPRVLEVATHKSCQAWLKRVVVDGYASQQGSYLYNLNLSFKRSQRILCVLLDSKGAEALTRRIAPTSAGTRTRSAPRIQNEWQCPSSP